jgi:hypothetical protein
VGFRIRNGDVGSLTFGERDDGMEEKMKKMKKGMTLSLYPEEKKKKRFNFFGKGI